MDKASSCQIAFADNALLIHAASPKASGFQRYLGLRAQFLPIHLQAHSQLIANATAEIQYWCRFQLAQCLKSQEGAVDWVNALPDDDMKGEALAFLATSVKDHGAVPTCIKLFQ